jgi:hypothetical protein
MTTPITPPAPDTSAIEPSSVRRSRTERYLESGLLGFCLLVFLFILWESQRWNPGVALLPRIACGCGVLVWLVYVARRVRPAAGQGQIMDLGFDEGELERHVVIGRTLRFVLTTAGLFLGIWLIGFHIAVPIYMVLYLRIYGGVRWWVAVLAALGFLSFMVLAYDVALRETWPEPQIYIPLPGVRY